VRSLDPLVSPQATTLTYSSAGIGRTGSFICLASLLQSQGPGDIYSPLGPVPDSYDEVMRTVDRVRESRGMLVQGPDQLGLIYQVIGVKCSV
jgi:protein-tyrosine phosphatase